MAANSSIEWTHHTFNPWWGCEKVSPGCAHCYAETGSKRFGFEVWGENAGRRFFKNPHWAEPLKWNRLALCAGERHRVFCGSYCDVCEDRPDLVEQRNRLIGLIEATPSLDWLLLTKRPENFGLFCGPLGWSGEWPRNVWAMTTCEDQERANKRIPELIKVNARIRGVSYEPALGPVRFHEWILPVCDGCGVKVNPRDTSCDKCGRSRKPTALDWIIVGGESGRGARPFNFYWARSTLRQCEAAGVACFVKQMGSNAHDAWLTNPKIFKDKKGSCPSEWPEDLRVREFPKEVGGRGERNHDIEQSQRP